MSGKRIIISDIHLGDDARYSDPEPERRARFIPSEHRERLLNFLNKQVIAQKENVKDLVLLGDVFDTWVCPFDALPPTYDSIFSSHLSEFSVISLTFKRTQKADGVKPKLGTSF